MHISNQQTSLAWIVGNHHRGIKQAINERETDRLNRASWRSSTWERDTHLLLRLRQQQPSHEGLPLQEARPILTPTTRAERHQQHNESSSSSASERSNNTINRSIKRSTTTPNQPTNQPINQPTNNPTNHDPRCLSWFNGSFN